MQPASRGGVQEQGCGQRDATTEGINEARTTAARDLHRVPLARRRLKQMQTLCVSPSKLCLSHSLGQSAPARAKDTDLCLGRRRRVVDRRHSRSRRPTRKDRTLPCVRGASCYATMRDVDVTTSPVCQPQLGCQKQPFNQRMLLVVNGPRARSVLQNGRRRA
jgi:hypothetical protein